MNEIAVRESSARSIKQGQADVLLACRGLGVRRGGRWLIRGVDLDVGRGEIVSIVGPNGGGKTTLIKTLLGIERATSGQVTRSTGVRVGYVPQRLAASAVLRPSIFTHWMAQRIFSGRSSISVRRSCPLSTPT